MRQRKFKVKETNKTFPALNAVLALFVLLPLFSCSLQYNSARKAPLAPELVLHNAEFRRIEDSRLIARMNADILESYRADNSLLGSGVTFEIFEDNGSLSARGSASLFFADQRNEQYTLLGDTSITSLTHDVVIDTGNIRWNNKTEQLVAAKNDEVSITLGGIKEPANGETAQTFTVKGRGFSADGAKQNFAFTGYVSGTIVEGAQ